MMPALDTPRLHLRPCNLNAVDSLCALWREPPVRRFLWDDAIISRQQAQEVVQAFLEAAADRGLGLWTLHVTEDPELAGFCALREIAETSEVELLFGLAPQHWGKGLATEASQAVLRYSFDELNLPRVWARTDPPNVASEQVMRRLGMHPATNPSAEKQPLLVYAIDRVEYGEPPSNPGR